MQIVISQMNTGTVAQRNLYSNQAEKAVIDAIQPHFIRPISHIWSTRVSHGDFYIDGVELGDIKIQTGYKFYIEITQFQRGNIINGWFHEYRKPSVGMEWLMFINKANSSKYNQIWKARLIPFQVIVHHMQNNITTADIKYNANGSAYCYINSTSLKNDGWLGHFNMPQTGIIDTTKFVKNPNSVHVN